MDTSEGQFLTCLWIEVRVGWAYFSSFHVRPTHKSHVIIEKQVAFCFALAYKEQCVALPLMGIKRLQVYIANDIYIVNQDVGGGQKEMGSLFQSTSRIKQVLRFVAYGYLHAEVIIGLKIVYNGLRKVVNVYHHAFNSASFQPFNGALQQSFTTNLNQSLGYAVGKRFKSCSQTCRKNHSLHHSRAVCILLCCKFSDIFSLGKGFTMPFRCLWKVCSVTS